MIQLTGTPGVSPDVERMFSAVDTDRSGKITPKELQQALQNGKGQNFSDRCCQLLVCTKIYCHFFSFLLPSLIPREIYNIY